jgi:hypothetical protein
MRPEHRRWELPEGLVVPQVNQARPERRFLGAPVLWFADIYLFS